MSLEYSNLKVFKSDSSIPIDIDEQICMFINYLKGEAEIKQIIAPSPESRVVYFIPPVGNPNAKSVEGYQKYFRDQQMGVEDKKKRTVKEK